MATQSERKKFADNHAALSTAKHRRESTKTIKIIVIDPLLHAKNEADGKGF